MGQHWRGVSDLSLEPMRILLVEDDRNIARFVAKGLREQAYAVDVTADGDDAIFKLSITDYDAVILDVMIPGRDGFSVSRTASERFFCAGDHADRSRYSSRSH